ncbi:MULTISPECIES: discoidin domain-containing protein [unclassified Pseudoxanthomonas]|uniref:discoidin domain-containing protein n=1 Tax=unclassified Pseudoxanthomonas TaxID=2645906 RepID=UPI0030781AF6
MLALALPLTATAQPATRILDDFSNPAAWRVVTSNQVSGSLRQVDGASGKALCLDYNFNGVSGHAAIQRDLSLDYPPNYQFVFQLRGDSPRNDLQFKLVDASGDNVWWVNRPKYDYPQQWTPVRYKRRHIDKAWGPDPEKTLRSSAKLEFTIYNNAGGKGSVCFDDLMLQPLPTDDGSPLRGSAHANASMPGSAADHAVDGDTTTAWSADFAIDTDPQLMLDLGRIREFGGLKLIWKEDEFASAYLVQLSDDGKTWRDARTVVDGNGGTDYLALPESEARYIRLTLGDGPASSASLFEMQVQPLAFAATPNDFVKSVAQDAQRGWYPRGFSGQQPYWTIVGIDGGEEQGLIGEDGAVEFGKGSFSIEPFVITDGRLATWSDAIITQSLQDGYLPIPRVDWKHAAFDLRVTAFAQGTRDESQLVARYQLVNTTSSPQDYVLALAVRPMQVNPPSQFLNTVGGVSRIDELSIEERDIVVNGQRRVRLGTMPDAAFASSFDAGDAIARIAGAHWPRMADVDKARFAETAGFESTEARDLEGLASGAVLYRVRLSPGQSYEVALLAPMTGGFGADTDSSFISARQSQAYQQAAAEEWRSKLDRVKLRLPPQGQAVADTLRTATAHMLISRIGPRLQPGTRSYSRSWIRDGAMISEGLLRMGREDVVKEYVEWYAPYQFNNGKVPCCVDDRGSDPVPENDSHGELIFNIAEYYRFTGDDAFLRKMWPHVKSAFGYMEELRLSERTEANRRMNPAFYGMMPASISHEGYSAKPVHSYWDNFWALRGYKDAAEVAKWLGKAKEAQTFAESRDQFRGDLYASLHAAVEQHGIDYLPGSAELGDFDATSTTIALAPGGEQGRLPPTLLNNTFERYWRDFEQRRDGKREWKDYTPYEWRNAAAFVRLGWRERAWKAIDFFFKDRAPTAWNQWAEVVSRTPRKPFFVGDLPHAWVASDFVRSALDMFAYVREVDDSIVLAAGVPTDWLEGEGIAIEGLRTPSGKLSYSLHRASGEVTLEIAAGLDLPSGGLILPWPYSTAPGATRINGRDAEWENGELRINGLPTKVTIVAH